MKIFCSPAQIRPCVLFCFSCYWRFAGTILGEQLNRGNLRGSFQSEPKSERDFSEAQQAGWDSDRSAGMDQSQVGQRELSWQHHAVFPIISSTVAARQSLTCPAAVSSVSHAFIYLWRPAKNLIITCLNLIFSIFGAAWSHPCLTSSTCGVRVGQIPCISRIHTCEPSV